MTDNIIRQTKTGRLVIRSQHRRQSIRAAIFTAMLHTIGCNCLLAGTLQLYCISQDAGDLYLGFLNFFIWAGCPFLLLGMVLMRRFGKRRILVFWMGIMPAFWMTFVLILPLFGHTGWISSKWILYLLLPPILLRSITDNIGGAAWFPVLQDNIPARITGKFFGTFRMYWQSGALICLLLTAWFLGKDPEWWKFFVVFVVGEACFITKIFFLRQLKEKPIPNPTINAPSIRQSIAQALYSRKIRYFLGYIFLYNVAAFMCLPFQIKYLKELGYSEGFIVLATSMVNLGAILSLRYWGRLADRFGNRALFNFSHIGMIVAIACWLLIGQNLFSTIFVFVLYVLWSVFQSANGIAQTRYMFHAVPETNQSMMVVIHTTMFISIALSTLISGFCLWFLLEVQSQSESLHINRYHLLFVFSASLIAINHVMHKHFQINNDTPTFEVFAVVTRTLRSLFGWFILFPKRRNGQR